MVAKLKDKISSLKFLLEKRNNKSYNFFNKLLEQLNDGLTNEVIDSIIRSYAIVQYADFNYKEEVLFDDIWNLANNIKRSNVS